MLLPAPYNTIISPGEATLLVAPIKMKLLLRLPLS